MCLYCLRERGQIMDIVFLVFGGALFVVTWLFVKLVDRV
jgi:hypothetical protein